MQVFDLPVLVGANAVRAQQCDSRAPSLLLGGVALPGDRFDQRQADGVIGGTRCACAKLVHQQNQENPMQESQA